MSTHMHVDEPMTMTRPLRPRTHTRARPAALALPFRARTHGAQSEPEENDAERDGLERQREERRRKEEK